MTEVVAALVWDGDRFMICQRPAHKARGLLWEFVGGKVEPGETKEEALVRECREELDITLRVGDLFMDVTHEYPDLTVHLSLFHAFIAAGVPKLLEHRDLKWITAEEISQYPFCPADEAILERIKEKALTDRILSAWDLPGTVLGTERYGAGHINDTFCVRILSPDGVTLRYMLQRISREAFPHPEELMENFAGITAHLRRKILEQGGDPQRETLSLVRTREGRDFLTDPSGSVWRLIPFIEGTFCVQRGTPELLEASCRAFGRFQRLLADYPAETLYETIPHFHDTEDRLARLREAIKKDPCGRAASVQEEIRFIREREADCSVAMDALRRGILPLKVTHNDTKLNNVLFDEKTREGICVIDLDTTMPGLSIFDFGDAVRFGANPAREDEKDLSRVRLDPALYECCTRGFLAGTAGSLSRAELEYLPWGARIITLELGIRFLTDYLNGDCYFRTSYPGQNLVRCRTQLKLVSSMEEQFDSMKAVTAKYIP